MQAVAKLLAFSSILLLPQLGVAQQQGRVVVPPNIRDAPLVPSSKQARGPSRLSTRLREIQAAYGSRGPRWHDGTATSGLVLRGTSEIKIELRFDPEAEASVISMLRGVSAHDHIDLAPGFMEVFLPVSGLEDVASSPLVYKARPARRVIPLEGASTTQGVAVSGADMAHGFGIDGSGITIAVIDVFHDSLVVPLQTSGDWPPPGRIDTVDMDGGGFGSLGIPHGNATVEIAYDMAPGANFIAYETQTTGEWYASILNAVSAGADVISVSLGTTLDGIGDGTAAPGSIAEAAGIAKAAGVLVVNAAGNESLDHWGGLYYDSAFPGSHDWDGPGEIGNLNIHPFCQEQGTVLGGDLQWDDWTDVDHDYDLHLFEYGDLSGWVKRATSDDFQNGLPGQTPTESIVYPINETLSSLICGGSGFGLFGWQVEKWNAPTDRNLHFFASTFLGSPVPERSLLFPGDSPNVITVAAVDATYLDQEFYSSEGPILAPGGGIPSDSTLGFKPDVSGFANVDTETYGPFLFNGTSSATPHVAGLAALMLQADTSSTVDELMDEIRSNALANDLGPVGFDPNYGYGKASWVGVPIKFAGHIFLEGPYSGGLMTTSSVFQDSLPLSQPYSDPQFDGTYLDFDDTVSVASLPPGTIDWVLTGLRESPASPTVARQPAFVLSDGSLVNTLGDTLVFEVISTDSFYVVLDHRNHQSVMSSSRVDFGTSSGSWDFTSVMTSAYTLGPDPMKDLGDGHFGMFGGNGEVDRLITTADFNIWLVQTKAIESGYEQGDYNLDGQVSAADFNLWLINTKALAASQVPN